MPVNSNEAVYEEWEHELIPSSYGANVHYRIFHGTVNWTRSTDGMARAIVVFIQYGDEHDWKAALRQNQIALNMPAHILSEDFDNVASTCARLHNHVAVREGGRL